MDGFALCLPTPGVPSRQLPLPFDIVTGTGSLPRKEKRGSRMLLPR